MTERIARWWSSTPPNPALIIGLATCLLASLLGWSLAYGLAYEMKWQKWLAFAALVMVALLPAVVRWPVVSTFGLYAFFATSLDALPLLPGGGTVAKPIGALAGAVLLGAGLIERRLGRPPAAALWWGAFMLWATLTTMWAVDSEAALTADAKGAEPRRPLSGGGVLSPVAKGALLGLHLDGAWRCIRRRARVLLRSERR